MFVVRNRDIRNIVLHSTFCLHFVCMIGKINVLVICIHKRVKSILFVVSIKFCDELGLAILELSVKCPICFILKIYFKLQIPNKVTKGLIRKLIKQRYYSLKSIRLKKNMQMIKNV